jgi:hypothetical protein|tara:strand:- start:1501 stop:1743 length:243 start_codon:yes stop_codon:yes gene_type:complete
MLTSDDVNTILKRLSLMRPNNRELEKEIKSLSKFIFDKWQDPDWTPVDDPDASSEEDSEDDLEEEEHIIDRTDPNFISIK